MPSTPTVTVTALPDGGSRSRTVDPGGTTTVSSWDRAGRLHHAHAPAFAVVRHDGSAVLEWYEHGRLRQRLTLAPASMPRLICFGPDPDRTPFALDLDDQGTALAAWDATDQGIDIAVDLGPSPR